ncbi:hypothetical protein FKM82_024692 [Ascaphus truei]
MSRDWKAGLPGTAFFSLPNFKPGSTARLLSPTDSSKRTSLRVSCACAHFLRGICGFHFYLFKCTILQGPIGCHWSSMCFNGESCCLGPVSCEDQQMASERRSGGFPL